MKILMILDSNADLHLARVFTAMQADVLVYSGDGMVGLEDDVFLYCIPRVICTMLLICLHGMYLL